MSELWSLGPPATEKVVRTVAVYGSLAVFLLDGARHAGRSDVSAGFGCLV